MARPVLPTDFKDDILAESMSGKRRYRIIQNADGTVSFDDVTDYEQVGSTFGAKQVNDMSSAVNSIEDVKAANNCTTTEPGFVLDARQGKTLMDKSNELSRDLHALNDSGAIKGLDAREDGVYITYSPTGGADAVTKKLGSPTIKTKAVTGNGSFDAGGKVLFAGIQNAGLHIMTYAQKYGQGSHYSATCSYAGNMITYDQHAYGENTSGTDQYSMTIIYAVE